MDVNLRKNGYFVQDERWYESDRRYSEFLSRSAGGKIVYAELGVGFNTPGIIRHPFERMTYSNDNATLIRLNLDDPEGARENRLKTIAFTEDMQEIVRNLME
jgi:hypothetical protein